MLYADTWMDTRGLDMGPIRVLRNSKGNNDRVVEVSMKVSTSFHLHLFRYEGVFSNAPDLPFIVYVERYISRLHNRLQWGDTGPCTKECAANPLDTATGNLV